MNPFSESYNSNSSRAKFNRRKHDDSYFSRVSNNTLEWIYHQSPLEQIFYAIVLIVFVIIFTAIYFMYTDHHVFQSEPLIMANSTPIISEPAVVEQTSTTQATTSSTPNPSDHHHHHHHHHYHYHRDDNIPLKAPVAPIMDKISEEKVNQSREIQSTSEKPTTRVPILTKTMETTPKPTTTATTTTSPSTTTTTTTTTTPTTTTSTTTSTTTTKPITSTSLITNSTPQLRATSQSLSTPKVPDSHRHYPHSDHHHVTKQTAPTTTPITTPKAIPMDRSSSFDVSKPLIVTESTSTQSSPTEVLDELDQLIEYKCNSLNKTDNIESPEKVDMKHLLHLASQMKNLNDGKSLCSFIGLNHLVIPFNNPDYYWFKNYSLDFDDSDDDLFDDWNPICRDNCSGLTELIGNKLNRFWDSCMNANQNITDFRNYMNSFGFKSYLPTNISEFDLNQLIKSLDYQGLVNFKPIPDHLNLNATINLVNRDDYPFIQKQVYEELIDYPDLIKDLSGYWNETNEDIKSINTEGLDICKSIQELPYDKIERINLNPIEYNSLGLSDLPINAIPNSDYLIEYNPNYLTDALATINKHQSTDLYYYLLFTNFKKNLIHLDDQSIDYTNIIDDDSHLNRTGFCLNMVTLPFGLIKLMDEIKSSQSKKIDLPKLADHLIDKVIKLILSKFTDDQATRNLLRDLSYNILEQLNHLISFDSNSIDEIYQSLKITDNYFDNVQSIRSWLRSGYKEGCLLNYISI